MTHEISGGQKLTSYSERNRLGPGSPGSPGSQLPRSQSLGLEAQGGRTAGDALRDQAIHVVEGGLFDVPEMGNSRGKTMGKRMRIWGGSTNKLGGSPRGFVFFGKHLVKYG